MLSKCEGCLTESRACRRVGEQRGVQLRATPESWVCECGFCPAGTLGKGRLSLGTGPAWSLYNTVSTALLETQDLS